MLLPPAMSETAAPIPATETIRYDEATVRRFVTATIVWGLVGMSVGLLLALQLD